MEKKKLGALSQLAEAANVLALMDDASSSVKIETPHQQVLTKATEHETHGMAAQKFVTNESDDLEHRSSDKKNAGDTSTWQHTKNRFAHITRDFFPQRLMAVLNDPSLSAVVSWLPHGRAFVILHRASFMKFVVPLHFSPKTNSLSTKTNTKFLSFTRKLNRWGFRLATRGPDMGAFHHPLFCRDRPELCFKMVCQQSMREVDCTMRSFSFSSFSSSSSSSSGGDYCTRTTRKKNNKKVTSQQCGAKSLHQAESLITEAVEESVAAARNSFWCPTNLEISRHGSTSPKETIVSESNSRGIYRTPPPFPIETRTRISRETTSSASPSHADGKANKDFLAFVPTFSSSSSSSSSCPSLVSTSTSHNTPHTPLPKVLENLLVNRATDRTSFPFSWSSEQPDKILPHEESQQQQHGALLPTTPSMLTRNMDFNAHQPQSISSDTTFVQHVLQQRDELERFRVHRGLLYKAYVTSISRAI